MKPNGVNAAGMRLGLMGGTFDPIHYGHLAAAEVARYEFGLVKVVFIPAGQPPHKTGQKISPAAHRLAMVRLAVASNPFFEVSTVEIDRPGPSYTVETVSAFRHLYSSAEIYFITGADAVAEISTWRRIEELLRLCWLVAVTRPGYLLEDLREWLVKPELWRKILTLQVPGVAVSSTEIRERVRAGRPVKYLLPEAVEDYIARHGLYL